MLKNIFILLLSVFPAILLAQDNGGKVEFPQAGKKFSLTGKITGLDTGRLILAYTNAMQKSVMDTVLLNKGNFKFEGVINQPTVARLRCNLKNNSMDHPNNTRIFIEPGDMEISLTKDDFGHAILKGSKTQIEYDKLNTQIESMGSDKAKQIRLNYITSHPNSFISPLLLFFYANVPEDSLKMLFGNLSSGIQQSSLGLSIARQLKSGQLAKVGDIAADFTAKDLNGEMISLKDFKGKKYVLLKFWYPGCIPCNEQNPQIKHIYENYKNKGLEVIGVSYNGSDRKTWENAIKKEGTGIWRNINHKEISKSQDNWPINLIYNVNAAPTLVLINKEGKIVYRTTGFSEEKGLKALEEYLTGL
ncbi:TlpA disulfide reductase family protein [Pedobacter frigoris]|uniref:AhpC/TSA family protein n=1 Tax=Pedobacter frigoris TaxID=2571272 RepID=A0A4U1CPC3_9SPHI|nr:TlpA disulfide reductase family protein [Pedobacter frigoris]TKC08605.1 AhpC/TSA family protein [Pedobacter frigoris]